MDERFSFLIAVRLIRDNWKAVIENYPTSLIGEIWFDLQDKQLLRIILLPLLVRFSLIYRIWALVLGLYLGDVINGLLLVLGPFLISFWACVLGLRAYYFKPHQPISEIRLFYQTLTMHCLNPSKQEQHVVLVLAVTKIWCFNLVEEYHISMLSLLKYNLML